MKIPTSDNNAFSEFSVWTDPTSVYGKNNNIFCLYKRLFSKCYQYMKLIAKIFLDWNGRREIHLVKYLLNIPIVQSLWWHVKIINLSLLVVVWYKIKLAIIFVMRFHFFLFLFIIMHHLQCKINWLM